jgi:hypothetical protein
MREKMNGRIIIQTPVEENIADNVGGTLARARAIWTCLGTPEM